MHGSRTGHSLTLALRYGDRGLVVHCHAGCAPRDVLAELRRMGLLTGRGDGVLPTSRPVGSDHRGDTARRTAAARYIWGGAREARGTPVARYLALRGITVTPPTSLRWALSLRRPDGGRGPAMVARVDGLDGELAGVHRTWLTRDESGIWRRRDRASIGAVGGGAVRLAPAAETLLVAEGIETALAAMQATAQPAWAALSTSGLVALRLPAMVRTVIILADHDSHGAGERAARTAAHRWLAEGRRVEIYISPRVGEDAADRLLATEARRAA
jgi:hypothetical protein